VICLPVIVQNHEPLIFRKYEIGDDLKPSEIFNKVLEPTSDKIIIEPDIVIVPILGFDQ